MPDESTTQPIERGALLDVLAASYGEPHELAAAAAPVVLGIDVSEHQGVIDWPAVAAALVAEDGSAGGFAIVKVREGTTYGDPRAAANLAGARAAGIPVLGAYGFLTATSSSRTQADAFVAAAPPDALHVVDVEAPGPLDVRGWVERYREHLPHHPLMIYTGKYLWSQRARVAYDGAAFGQLWVAGAVASAYVPGVDESLHRSWARVGQQNGGLPFHGWSSWTLMQFTEAARVPGVPTRVDGNAFRGTIADLRVLAGAEPPKPPQPHATTIHGPVKYGSTDDTTHGSVSPIQHRLDRQLGVHVTIDGDYGRQTMIAVEDWQERHHLTKDGVVGPKTAASMGFAYEDQERKR
jgi:GH25 family lysozyme M1 (1,4-beta-N-acetylmuramidase)